MAVNVKPAFTLIATVKIRHAEVSQLTSRSELWGQQLCTVYDGQYVDLICFDTVNNPIGSFDHLPDVRCFILRHHAS